uniref:Putative reverse transcriptase domain-containing protein n=1 Tax=Tanacetum cinerariifolium TaxID=118510 RepID=A0A6L2MGI5_TANCI|nr:putative reverse transcriptase domain-containing protein [Tanacetum cinerariifolium]
MLEKRLILVIANSTLSLPFLFIVLETFPCVMIDGVTLTKSGEESVNHGTQARKYIKNGCELFLAQVTKQGSKEKRLEDAHVIRDYPEVFLDELPGLPSPRQVEFRIDLIPSAAPVARAPYCLAPSEMKELSKQLRELSEKGFIRPSSSLWGAPILLQDPFIIIPSIIIDYSPLNESTKSEDEDTDSEDKETALEGQQQQAILTEDTAKDKPLGLGYRAAGRRALSELGILCLVLTRWDRVSSLHQISS